MSERRAERLHNIHRETLKLQIYEIKERLPALLNEYEVAVEKVDFEVWTQGHLLC